MRFVKGHRLGGLEIDRSNWVGCSQQIGAIS
jgi:hypothetical protein